VVVFLGLEAVRVNRGDRRGHGGVLIFLSAHDFGCYLHG